MITKEDLEKVREYAYRGRLECGISRLSLSNLNRVIYELCGSYETGHLDGKPKETKKFREYKKYLDLVLKNLDNKEQLEIIINAIKEM